VGFLCSNFKGCFGTFTEILKIYCILFTIEVNTRFVNYIYIYSYHFHVTMWAINDFGVAAIITTGGAFRISRLKIHCVHPLTLNLTFEYQVISLLFASIYFQDFFPGEWWVSDGCWCGYLSGARCRLFAYGPADATTSQKTNHILPHLNPDWFYLSADRLTQAVLEKRPLNGCSSNSSSFTVATAPCLIYDCWKIYESFITFFVETFPPRIFREILHIDLNLLATFTLQ